MAYYRLYRFIFIACLLPSAVALAVPDQDISMNIIYQLARNHQTFTSNIETVCNDGRVRLRGEANTTRQAQAIIEIASATTGVQEVMTRQLTLPYGKAIPVDDVIKAKITGTMQRENINSSQVQFKVNKQIVYLESSQTPAEKRKLRALLHTIPEIRAIEDEPSASEIKMVSKDS